MVEITDELLSQVFAQGPSPVEEIPQEQTDRSGAIGDLVNNMSGVQFFLLGEGSVTTVDIDNLKSVLTLEEYSRAFPHQGHLANLLSQTFSVVDSGIPKERQSMEDAFHDIDFIFRRIREYGDASPTYDVVQSTKIRTEVSALYHEAIFLIQRLAKSCIAKEFHHLL